MKRLHRKLPFISGFVLLLFFMTTPLTAEEKEPSFSRAAFPQVKDILCKEYDEETCVYKNFYIEGVDLNGDKKPEWFFYGPSADCGAHGNCPSCRAVL